MHFKTYQVIWILDYKSACEANDSEEPCIFKRPMYALVLTFPGIIFNFIGMACQ